MVDVGDGGVTEETTYAATEVNECSLLLRVVDCAFLTDCWDNGSFEAYAGSFEKSE